jgi:acetylglutamate kinase
MSTTFRGNDTMKTVCVKIGGATFDTPGLMRELAQSVKELAGGHFCMIVHGGGKDIGRELDRLNRKFEFVEGMRVTDKQTMRVVQMVLSGDLNKRLVSEMLSEGVAAIGISGVDGNLLQVKRMMVGGRDIGFVGAVETVDTAVISMCRDASMVPVISPVSRDREGNIYNVNADMAAAEIAMAIGADHLVYVSDVPGVSIDGAVAHRIKTSEIEYLIEQGHVGGGMVPKLRSAAGAVARGVGWVHIAGWHGPKTLREELEAATSSGTVIYRE